MKKRSAISGQRSATRVRRSLISTGRRGVALMDVIIGGVLLAVGLAVVISLAARSMKTQTDGEKRMVASWLADELLNMVLVEGPVNYPKMYDTSGSFYPPFQEYEYDVVLEDRGVNVPFRVTANIRWAAGLQQIQVQTLIAERGGDPDQPRAPKEPVDRMERWYPDESTNPQQ